MCVPTNWVPIPGQDPDREAMATILTMAAAHSNAIVVAAADRVGVERGRPSSGRASPMVSGTGWPAAGPASPTSPELLVAEVDLLDARRSRGWGQFNNPIRDPAPRGVPRMSTPDVVALASRLIEIDTVGRNESAALEALAPFLVGAGLAVTRQEWAPGRSSLVASIGGRGGFVLSGHVDTVPFGNEGWRHGPLAPTIDGDRLIGRGSSDMKGGLAAIVLAAVDAARRGARAFTVVITGGEETGCDGARALRDAGLAPEPSVLVIGESTGNELCLGHKGATWLEVTASGTSAHGSRPDLGVNAIEILADAIVALRTLDAGDRHPELGSRTTNVGTRYGRDADQPRAGRGAHERGRAPGPRARMPSRCARSSRDREPSRRSSICPRCGSRRRGAHRPDPCRRGRRDRAGRHPERRRVLHGRCGARPVAGPLLHPRPRRSGTAAHARRMGLGSAAGRSPSASTERCWTPGRPGAGV